MSKSIQTGLLIEDLSYFMVHLYSIWASDCTWSFKSLFLFGAGLGIDVTGHMEKWEEKMMFLVELRGELNLHLILGEKENTLEL